MPAKIRPVRCGLHAALATVLVFVVPGCAVSAPAYLPKRVPMQCQELPNDPWCRLVIRVAQGPGRLGRAEYARALHQLRTMTRAPPSRELARHIHREVAEALEGRESVISDFNLVMTVWLLTGDLMPKVQAELRRSLHEAADYGLPEQQQTLLAMLPAFMVRPVPGTESDLCRLLGKANFRSEDELVRALGELVRQTRAARVCLKGATRSMPAKIQREARAYLDYLTPKTALSQRIRRCARKRDYRVCVLQETATLPDGTFIGLGW